MSAGGNNDARVPFEDAIHKVFDRNEQTGKGPTSIRALARALVLQSNPGVEPEHRQIEEWRRQLRRYMSGERQPRPDTLTKIVAAALAKPDDFPKPRPQGHLRQRVEALERENERLRSLLDRRDRGHS